MHAENCQEEDKYPNTTVPPSAASRPCLTMAGRAGWDQHTKWHAGSDCPKQGEDPTARPEMAAEEQWAPAQPCDMTPFAEPAPGARHYANCLMHSPASFPCSLCHLTPKHQPPILSALHFLIPKMGQTIVTVSSWTLKSEMTLHVKYLAYSRYSTKPGAGTAPCGTNYHCPSFTNEEMGAQRG